MHAPPVAVKLNRNKRVPLSAAAPPVSGAPRCQQVFSPLSPEQEEDGGSGHTIISSPLSPTCSRVRRPSGRNRAGRWVFSPDFRTLLPSPAASAQPPLSRPYWDHLLQQVRLPGSPLSLPPFSPFFPSFLPLTDSSSPLNVELRGRGLSRNQSQHSQSVASVHMERGRGHHQLQQQGGQRKQRCSQRFQD